MPVGLGDGVGDCHDAADLQREGLFNSLCSFLEEKTMLLLTVWFFYFSVLLTIPVTKREPTAGYSDAYSVGNP